MADNETGVDQGAGSEPGTIKLGPILDHQMAGEILNQIRQAAASGEHVTVDASDVERLHTPVAQVLVSAATSCDFTIRAPSDDFVSACTDLGIWSRLSERIET